MNNRRAFFTQAAAVALGGGTASATTINPCASVPKPKLTGKFVVTIYDRDGRVATVTDPSVQFRADNGVYYTYTIMTAFPPVDKPTTITGFSILRREDGVEVFHECWGADCVLEKGDRFYIGDSFCMRKEAGPRIRVNLSNGISIPAFNVTAAYDAVQQKDLICFDVVNPFDEVYDVDYVIYNDNKITKGWRARLRSHTPLFCSMYVEQWTPFLGPWSESKRGVMTPSLYHYI